MMPQIRPISDLRDTTRISELCHSLQEPVFITKNGYGDMVIMSNEIYEEQLAAAEIFRKLLTAQRQLEAGEGLDGDEELAKLRSSFGYQEP